MVEDVTGQVRAEEQLHEKEAQYRSIFEATSDALIINDLDGFVVEANPAAWEMHGYTQEEFVGLHHTVYVHPERHPYLPRYAAEIEAGGTVHTRGINVRKDGSSFPVDVHGTRFLYHGALHTLAVIRDVTEQVQAYELLEARVEERTRELATLLEVAHNVASTLQLEPLLGLILEQLKMVADYDGATLMKLQDQALQIVEYRGPNPRSEMVGLRFPLERIAPIWEQAQQQRPVIIPDIRGNDELARAFRTGAGALLDGPFSYIRSWMGIPLTRKGKTVGMVSIAASDPTEYTPGQAGLVMALASQAAVAIENAELYEQAQEVAALQERARLARELHDSVTQALFSMTMHVRAAQLALGGDAMDLEGVTARNLQQLSDLTQGALAEMRALIFELRPGSLQEEGLPAALRKHAAAVSAREGLQIEVDAPAGRVPLAPATDLHLYRLAQEALHNVIKHAGADQVRIRLEVGTDRVVLEIVDNGTGFELAAVPPGHLGLRTMTDRVESMGGTLRIQTAPGAGTLVRAIVPSVDARPHD